MLKHGFLIIVLLAFLAIDVPGRAHAAPPAKKEAKKHKHDKNDDGTARLTKKQKRQQKKDLKKKEKREHKQAKIDRKKEKANSKKAGLTKAQRKQQLRALKNKQKQERLKLKQEQKQLKHGKAATPSVTMVTPPPPVIVKKKQEIVYPPTQMKPRYRVDILAPMFLDDLVKGGSVTYKDKMPDKALAGITFYEGVSIAADSLKRAGFNIDIYVHDVASAAESVDMLVKKGSLDSADLIIGAVQSHDIPVVADYARKKKVNFVSVLSASDAGVRDNEYFTMIQPSLRTHCHWIDSDVAKKFPGMKPTLLYRTSVQVDSDAYRFITNDTPGKANFKMLSCNALPRKSDLLSVIDTTRPNVIVVSILDINYSDSLLREISHDFPATHFEVYGMPSWNSMSSLRSQTAFPNLSVNVPTPFNIDPSMGVAKYVNHIFKRDYGGRTTEAVYRGYETMFWYAYLLKTYGTMFNLNYSDNAEAPFTKFDIKPQWDKNDDVLYDENTRIFVTKYEGGNAKSE